MSRPTVASLTTLVETLAARIETLRIENSSLRDRFEALTERMDAIEEIAAANELSQRPASQHLAPVEALHLDLPERFMTCFTSEEAARRVAPAAYRWAKQQGVRCWIEPTAGDDGWYLQPLNRRPPPQHAA